MNEEQKQLHDEFKQWLDRAVYIFTDDSTLLQAGYDLEYQLMEKAINGENREG